MERCVLVQLVNRRDELAQKYKAQPGQKLKKTTEAKSNGDSRVRMAKVSLPEWRRLTRWSERETIYEQRQTTLRNKLSKGRNWQSFAKRFAIGVLPLVPIDGEF